MDTASKNKKRIRKKILPAVLAMSIFMQMLDSTVLNTSLTSIALDFKQSPLDMQSVIISYVLTLAIFMPLSSFLADKFGTKKVFVSSLFLFSAGSLFCSFSTSLTQLVCARVIQGLGASLMTPVGKLTLIKTFEKKELMKALNFAVLPALFGPILGPLVGGYMVDYLSWHWIFLINIPFGILGIILSARYMPDFKSKISDFDFKGFMIFIGFSLLLSISLELLGREILLPSLMLFSLGLAMIYWYHLHALKKDDPIFPLQLFQIRTFRIGIIGNLVTRLGISSIPILIPMLIQMAYGRSALISGLIVAPMAVTGMLGKSVVISILNNFGYRKTLVLNTIIIGILICCFAIPAITTIYWLLPIVLALGFFNSIQFTAMESIAIADLRYDYTGSGNSLVLVNQRLAVGFGIALGLFVLKFFQENYLSCGIHLAFRLTFLSIGFLTIVSGLTFTGLHKRDGNGLVSK